VMFYCSCKTHTRIARRQFKHVLHVRRTFNIVPIHLLSCQVELGVLPARCDAPERLSQIHLNRRARAVGNKKPRRTRGAWEDSSAFADCRRNPCARYRFCPNTASNVLNLYTVFHYCRHEPTWRLRDSNP
jgi:hypothetical protein